MESRKLSYWHGEGPIFPLGRTLADYLSAAAGAEPEKVAIVHGNRSVTFGELWRSVKSLALGLLGLGLRRGDRIGLCLPDCPEYSMVYFAAARLGLVSTPINIRYRAAEVATILGHSEARAVVIPAEIKGFDYVAMVAALQPRLPALEFALVLGDHPQVDQAPGVVSLPRLVATGHSLKPPDDRLHGLDAHPVEADDLLEISYTSGTTGAPKGAMTTHNNRAAAALLNCEAWGARPDDIMVAMSPLTHSIGAHHSQNAAILGRFTVVYLGQWEAELALRAAERNRATILIGVPAMFVAMVNHPEFRRYDLSSVRLLWCAGAPLPFQVAKQLSEAFGAEFSQTYGSTECGGVHCTRAGDPLEVTCASAGPPVRGVETKIVDPQTGRMVLAGQPGELCIRGVTRCLGYYNNPEETARVFAPTGWFHTGDLGVMDAHGYVRIIGRIKDMIIRGGQNIYATEMESLLCAHPAVQQAFVVGYPDDYLGERTCAFIVARDPQTRLDRPGLVDFFGDQVARYKIPDRVQMVQAAELPLTPSGKVQKHKLRAGLLDMLRADALRVPESS